MLKQKSVLVTFLASCSLFLLVACGEKTTPASKTSQPSVSSVDSKESATSSKSASQSDVQTYHVRFVNDDETLLYETDVEEGGEAVYVGDEPTKEEDDEFTYVFDGWDHDLTNVHEDFVTKAVYKSEPKENWGSIIWF